MFEYNHGFSFRAGKIHQRRLPGAVAGEDPVGRQRHVRPPQQCRVLPAVRHRDQRLDQYQRRPRSDEHPRAGHRRRVGLSLLLRIAFPGKPRGGPRGDAAGPQQRHLPARRVQSPPRRRSPTTDHRARALGARVRRPGQPQVGPDPRCHPITTGNGQRRRLRSHQYAWQMPVLSKTVEVGADADSILAIVADFERYPEWNEGVKGCWVLARYDDGRPSQLRLDTVVQGIEGTYIQAVYYPGPNQMQTVMQQGELFSKQEQLFSWVESGPTTLLTVDIDVETTMPVPAPMVKMLLGNVLDQLAENLKLRAEQLASN